MLELPAVQTQSPVALKIDEVVAVIDQYQSAILRQDGLTETNLRLLRATGV